MDLQVLKFFSVIATEGSFLGASQKLGYAQSNLSTKIKQLEAELGAELFHRTKQGVTLTEKGTVLLEYADKILRLTSEARSSIAEGDNISSSLHIGAMESAAITFLPNILTKFHFAEPSVQMTVETYVSRTAAQKVCDYELDGAFVAGGVLHPALEHTTVFQEKLVLLARPAENEPRDLEHLLSMPLLVLPTGCSYRQTLESLLVEKNILPNRIVEFRSLGALLASISAGLGVSLFPASVVGCFAGGQALEQYEIPEKYRNIPVHFIWRKKSNRNLTLEKFRLLIKEMMINK